MFNEYLQEILEKKKELEVKVMERFSETFRDG